MLYDISLRRFSLKLRLLMLLLLFLLLLFAIIRQRLCSWNHRGMNRAFACRFELKVPLRCHGEHVLVQLANRTTHLWLWLHPA